MAIVSGEAARQIEEQIRAEGELPKGKSGEDMLKAYTDWIDKLVDHANKAKKELKSKKAPGRASSEFMGFINGRGYEDWYNHFYG